MIRKLFKAISLLFYPPVLIKPDRSQREIKHEYIKDPNELFHCLVCGSPFWNHCVTGEHTVSSCPGDHGK